MAKGLYDLVFRWRMLVSFARSPLRRRTPAFGDTVNLEAGNALQRRAFIVKQFPEAAVLGCSDLRVLIALIFDQGPGGIFAIRIARNVLEMSTTVVEYIALVTAVTYAAESPVIKHVAPAQVVVYIAPALAVYAGQTSNDHRHHAEQETLRPVVSNTGLRLVSQVLRGLRCVDTTCMRSAVSCGRIHYSSVHVMRVPLPAPVWATESLESSLERLCLARSYMQYRAHKGLDIHCFLEPSGKKQYLHKLTAGVDGVQQCCQTRASGQTGFLPAGLPSGVYARCAAAIPMPFGLAPELPDDLLFAIRLSCGQVPGVPLNRVRRWWESQLRLLQRMCKPLEECGLGTLFEELRSQASLKWLASSFQLGLLWLYTVLIEVPLGVARAAAAVVISPSGVFRYLVLGSSPGPAKVGSVRHTNSTPAGSALLGEIPRSDIYRAAEVQAECSLEDLVDSAPKYISEFLALPAPASAQADAIWTKTETEIQAGLMSEPMTKVSG